MMENLEKDLDLVVVPALLHKIAEFGISAAEAQAIPHMLEVRIDHCNAQKLRNEPFEVTIN